MKVLLVEDEVHKRDELSQCVKDVLNISPVIVDSVRSAYLSVTNEDFDLIILDMALPTFTVDGDDNTKGHDQGDGGVEVLRTLRSCGKQTKIIIVTQYHDFVVSGKKVKLKDSAKPVFDAYNQKVIGAVLYKYNSKQVINKINSILRGIK